MKNGSFAILIGLAYTATAWPSPSLAPKVCNVQNYGARGDGATLDTDAIQRAVNDCQGSFGIVELPSGTYLSGMIRLGNEMTFRLDAGATLLGVRAGDEAYPTLNPNTQNTQLLNCRKALLYAEGARQLTIEGPGTIDGDGGWSAWSGNIKEAKRPMALFMFHTTSLVIKNLNVQNAAMWSVVLMETSHSLVDGLNVHSPFGPTRDGLDIVDGQDVTVQNTTIFSEDDSICLKSGIASGLQNIIVRDSRILGSLVANGLKFGTASTGILRDVTFENIEISNVRQAGIAVESVDGSNIRGITFRNIRMDHVGTPLYVLLGWRGNQSDPHPGSISDLVFENIQGDQFTESWGSAISGTVIGGLTYAPTHLLFQNVDLNLKGDPNASADHLPSPPPEYDGGYPDPRNWGDLPAAGLYFRHVREIQLRNVQISNETPGDDRPLVFPAP